MSDYDSEPLDHWLQLNRVSFSFVGVFWSAVALTAFMCGVLVGFLSSGEPRIGSAALYWYGFALGILAVIVFRWIVPYFLERTK